MRESSKAEWISKRSSCLQPIVAWIHLHHTRIAVAFALWNFSLPAAKKNKTITPRNLLRLWSKVIRKPSSAHHKYFFLKSRLFHELKHSADLSGFWGVLPGSRIWPNTVRDSGIFNGIRDLTATGGCFRWNKHWFIFWIKSLICLLPVLQPLIRL